MSKNAIIKRFVTEGGKGGWIQNVVKKGAKTKYREKAQSTQHRDIQIKSNTLGLTEPNILPQL